MDNAERNAKEDLGTSESDGLNCEPLAERECLSEMVLDNVATFAFGI